MAEKIRIKDIAERAGVSVGTVDRVLHKRPNVSESALKRVEKVLKEMNYQPNVYASALAYNKSYTFYCLIPKHSSEAYWEEIEIGAMKAVEARRDFYIDLEIMYYSRLDPHSFIETYQKCLRQNPDGVILVPTTLEVTRQFTDELHDRNIPFILLDSYAIAATAVILRTGLYPEWSFCCSNADAHCSKGGKHHAHEADEGRKDGKSSARESRGGLPSLYGRELP